MIIHDIGHELQALYASVRNEMCVVWLARRVFVSLIVLFDSCFFKACSAFGGEVGMTLSVCCTHSVTHLYYRQPFQEHRKSDGEVTSSENA